MKKALSVLLAVLMMFSLCSVAFAKDSEDSASKQQVVLTFLNHDLTTYETKVAYANEKFTGPAVSPTRANETIDGKEYSFKFRGWAEYNNGEVGEKIYNTQTFDYVSADTTYIAVYAKEEVEEIMTFWNLIQMIFSKFNMIFEYFFEIFK